jgi:hypothetical protein
MKPRRILEFFAALATELDRPARVYLTGAAAAALWGRVRPSYDVDFGIELTGRTRWSWEEIQAAVARTSALTGIAASAAEDIDRWGMITLLDYKRNSRSFQRFDRLDLRLLDPVHWSIGKLTRFLQTDVTDVVAVLQSQGIEARRAARVWGKALAASPRSTAQFLFRKQVEAFLD